MNIGQRLREIRVAKELSQDDIERSTGLVRPYISRVENGHTIPSIKTLQKWAAALGMQLYQVLYEGEEPPKPPKAQSRDQENLWGNSGRDARQRDRLRRLLAKMDETDRNALIAFAAQLVRRYRMK